jgi:hypothetical protein
VLAQGFISCGGGSIGRMFLGLRLRSRFSADITNPIFKDMTIAFVLIKNPIVILAVFNSVNV